MRAIATTAAIAVILTLTACDNSDTGSKSDEGSISVSNGGRDYTFTSADGKKQVHVSAAGEAPVDMPDFLPLYPGAKVQASMVNAQTPGAGGGGLNFMTPDSPGKVIGFYRKKARAAGMTESLHSIAGPSAMLIAENKGKKTGMHVVTTKDGDQTNVQLYWSSPKS